jgi:sugar fermentation stimulation protein A
MPNDRTHPAFGAALRAAEQAGVELLAYDCRVAPDRLELNQPVPICLSDTK